MKSKKGKIEHGKHTFIREGSESAGILPSLDLDTRDSGLRRSSPVLWKV